MAENHPLDPAIARSVELLRRALALVLLAAFLFAEPATAEPDPAGAAAPADPLARIAVVGASASAGYGAFLPGEQEAVSLARALESALTPDQTRTIALHASPFFFTRPHQFGPELLDAALADDPTLLVALDYLFWFCYGTIDETGGWMAGEAARLRSLEAGLDRLEQYDGPIIVGELPDMSPAIGGMLMRSQVPRPETLAKANQRIRAWAAERDNVIVFPLDALTRQIRAGEGVRLAGLRFNPDDAAKMIQPDRLHPSVEGQIATAILALKLVDDWSDEVAIEDYRIDQEAVRAALTPGTP